MDANLPLRMSNLGAEGRALPDVVVMSVGLEYCKSGFRHVWNYQPIIEQLVGVWQGWPSTTRVYYFAQEEIDIQHRPHHAYMPQVLNQMVADEIKLASYDVNRAAQGVNVNIGGHAFMFEGSMGTGGISKMAAQARKMTDDSSNMSYVPAGMDFQIEYGYRTIVDWETTMVTGRLVSLC